MLPRWVDKLWAIVRTASKMLTPDNFTGKITFNWNDGVISRKTDLKITGKAKDE
jgi:hypothetical protein